MNKKLSIITVVRNDLDGLKNTFESLKAELNEDVEWVVVDGLSNDGTSDFLENLNNNFITWNSEKDKNMYDAMNKGIKNAKGSYLQFLNAGDILINSIRDNFLNYHNNADIIFYDILKYDHKGKKMQWKLPLNFLEHLSTYPSVPHQSTFILKDLFYTYGFYSEEYKYLGDYEFFCRIFNKVNIPKIDIAYRLETPLVSFKCNGITFQYRLSLILMKECEKIQKIYYGRIKYRTSILYFFKYLISFIPKHIEFTNLIRRVQFKF